MSIWAKPKHTLWLAAVSLSISANAQQEKKAKTEVKSAIVSLNSAQVKTETRTEAEAGVSKVVISPFPGYLSVEDLQINGRGEATILGIAFRTKELANLPKTKELLLAEDTLRNLEYYFDSLGYVVEALQKERSLLLDNNKIAGTQTGLKTTELEDAADLYRERLPYIAMLIVKTNKKRELFQERIAKIMPKINELRQLREKTNGELVVTLMANSKSAVVLEVDYPVNEAGWRPTYDLRFSKNYAQAQLQKKAIIYQNTGIHWDNVILTLSTRHQNGPVYVPEFVKKQVDFQPETQLYGVLQGRAAGVQVFKKSRAAMSDEKVMEDEVTSSNDIAPVATTEMQQVQSIEVPANIGNLTYYLPHTYTLPSNGKPETFAINSTPLAPQYKHVVMPAYDNVPLFTARLTDWEKLDIIDGTANIYFNGQFAGTTFLNSHRVSDTLEIGVTKDEKINVTREAIKEFTSRKTIGTQKRDEYAYMITLRNTNREPVNLVLTDQVPVSKDSRIEVEFVNDSNAAYYTEEGKLVWKLNLAPSETKKIVFKYAIKYPKDKEINIQ